MLVAVAGELRARYPLDPEAPRGAACVMRTGDSEIYEHITDELLVQGARASSSRSPT